MNKIVVGLFMATVAISQCTEPALFLSRIENKTSDILYKVIVPDEDYEMLVPPGQTADFGQWLNLLRSNEVQLAAIGDEAGDPIFVTKGPESTGCSQNDFAQSVIYWCGAPSIDASQKIYKTCCMTKDLALALTIQEDGTPEIAEIVEGEQA